MSGWTLVETPISPAAMYWAFVPSLFVIVMQVDLLGARVGAHVLDVRVDVPVDAARAARAAEAGRTEDEGDRIVRVRLVRLVAVANDELDRAVGDELVDVMALHARHARRREVGVVGCRDRRRERAGEELVELAGAIDLGLHPAGDTRLDVAPASSTSSSPARSDPDPGARPRRSPAHERDVRQVP